MCDEYDDERMRVLWRRLSEQDGLVILPTDTVDAPAEPMGMPPAPGMEIPKPKPKVLGR